jgi:hypothetical protein
MEYESLSGDPPDLDSAAPHFSCLSLALVRNQIGSDPILSRESRHQERRLSHHF